jgi:hypothetical protein
MKVDSGPTNLWTLDPKPPVIQWTLVRYYK